jgi:hypothetical protein
MERPILSSAIKVQILWDNYSKIFANFYRLRSYIVQAIILKLSGSVERSHRTINEYLRSFINKDANNWVEFLPYATFTYNTTPHTERHLLHSN